VGGVIVVFCCDIYQAEHHHIQAMHEPIVTDDSVGLLGEDIARTGQALKLG
jgi:hypothetical protein